MFPLFFAQVNILLNAFSLVFVQEKVLCSFLWKTMFVSVIIEYFSMKLTRLLDLPSKLSTHDLKLSFQKNFKLRLPQLKLPFVVSFEFSFKPHTFE